MNPVHTQKETIKSNYQKGSKPPAPPLVIAREKLAEYIRRNGPDTKDLEYDRKLFETILAGRGGLSPTQAKEFLGEDPQWRKWPWLEHLDSQQEIVFPDPERKPPAAEATYIQTTPEAVRLWEYVRDYLKHRLSPHSFDTWIKPLRPLDVENGVLRVKGPTPEFRHVLDKYGALIAEALKGKAGELAMVVPEEQSA